MLPYTMGFAPEFILFMTLFYGLPPLLLVVGLIFKKPGDPVSLVRRLKENRLRVLC